jgi:primosomal protein N' (replication factor Y)
MGQGSGSGVEDPQVVRVLPDEPGIGKAFDYTVPEGFPPVAVGDRVRVSLAGRRVGGWVVEAGGDPAPGVELKPLAKWSGRGPSADLIDLAGWAAWRWAGRAASFLRTASPERVVAGLPRPAVAGPALPVGEVAGKALATERAVVRLAPATDPYPLVAAATTRGNVLVLCPTQALVRSIAGRLRRDGVAAATYPDDWAQGAAGATVVGTRAAAWAPIGDLAAVVVVDEHDEAHQQEAAPTWHARDVAAERARRAGVPCVLVSPCPSLEALGWGELVTRGRAAERAGWPAVDVVDMRAEDPRTGLLPPALVRVLRSDKRVVCVLNRTGRARLLACAGCGELARCERCDAAVSQPASPGDVLACGRCGETRPVVCLHCGKTRLKALRQGVTRVRDEIEALVGEPVAEVTGSPTRPAARAAAGAADLDRARVVVGTEASLHQVARADVVAFLDLDQELLAPRYRAAEQALGLVARAARLVGGRERGGRLLLQTHVPDHEVVHAAVLGDPTRVAEAEADRRTLLRFPPVTALAEVSGPVAAEFVAALRGDRPPPAAEPPAPAAPQALWGDAPTSAGVDQGEGQEGASDDEFGGLWGEPAGSRPGVEVLGPADGKWLVRAPDHVVLCDALAATPRPAGRLRVAVDPPRI